MSASRNLIAALCLLVPCGIVAAQTLAPAQLPPPAPPPRHATTRHAPTKTTGKTVPARTGMARTGTARTGTARTASGRTRPVAVLAPRHAGPPRHAVAARKPAAKPAVAVAKPPPPPEAAKPAPTPADIGSNTGLHLPRYASLKSDDVNMRVGPAERYPVIWTYKRRELPVRIEREFDIWRLVEDMDGVKGWVHQATLTGRRTFVVTGTLDRTLRADASDTADPVAVLKPGVVGRIRSCDAGKAWCQVQVQDYRGWLQRSSLWGVDADEGVAP